MLQFITDPDAPFSAAEQAGMFAEAGGMWVQMSIRKDNPDLRAEVELVKEVAQKDESFLVLDHDVDLVNELKVHGVHLSAGDMLPREARELLGPHAVIGVSVTSAAEVIALKSADIDYVQSGPFPEVAPEKYASIVAEVRDAGVEIPIVATGEIANTDLKTLMATGISGIAIGGLALRQPDPVAYFREALSILGR